MKQEILTPHFALKYVRRRGALGSIFIATLGLLLYVRIRHGFPGDLPAKGIVKFAKKRVHFFRPHLCLALALCAAAVLLEFLVKTGLKLRT